MIHHSTVMPLAQPTRRQLITFAWGAMLLVSALPAIIWRLVAPATPPWLVWAQAGAAVGLLVCAHVLPTLRPLRGFLLALLALTAGWLAKNLILQSGDWQHATQALPWGLAKLAEHVMRLLPALLVALTLLGSGLGRRELFLVKGDLDAPAQPSRLLWFKTPIPWNRLAGQLILAITVVLTISLLLSRHIDVSKVGVMLVSLPAIVLSSALNAASEEFQFRSVLLARLGPVVGAQQALWISAVLFGLGHHDFGLIALPLFIWAGWVWGKSMLETGGFTWAWVIHSIQDIVILAIVAMTG